MKIEQIVFGATFCIVTLSFWAIWYLSLAEVIPGYVVALTLAVAVSAALTFILRSIILHYFKLKECTDFSEVSNSIQNIKSSLAQNKKWLQLLLDAPSSGSIVLSPEFFILEMNSKASKIFSKNVVGCSILSIIEDVSFTKALEQSKSDLKSYYTTLTIGEATYRSLIVPCTWEDHLIKFYITLTTQLPGYDRDIIHDIRTPLTTIMNAAEILLADGDDKKVREKFIPMIDTQAKRLKILSDSLKMRKL